LDRPPYRTHLASRNGYEDAIWFTGSPQEALDFVCDL
jgi:hypothetical protein